jgi:hypothetical protein
MARDTAIYVYCLARAARRPRASGLPEPLPGASAPALAAVDDGVVLVTSEVPLEIYAPAQLEPRLRDLDWVSEVAVAHERIVQHFARRAGITVIPMKMFTMFSSLDKAIADVRSRRREIDRTIMRVAGCEEWGIRVTKVPGGSGGRTTKRGTRAESVVSSGTAFLAARRDARDAVVAAKSVARSAADRAFTGLARLARDARRRDERQEPGSNPPILEAAFLVRTGTRARFKAEARRQAASCEAAGAAMVLTGPWAPYNFVNSNGERA